MLFPCSFPTGKIKRRNKEGRFLLYSFSAADRLCWESYISISWDILIWQKKRMAWYQEQLSVEWGSQNVWKDGVMFSIQYFGMLCRLTIMSRDILTSCWGWMGRVVRGYLERFGGTAVLGAALLRLEGHPRVPSQNRHCVGQETASEPLSRGVSSPWLQINGFRCSSSAVKTDEVEKGKRWSFRDGMCLKSLTGWKPRSL